MTMRPSRPGTGRARPEPFRLPATSFQVDLSSLQPHAVLQEAVSVYSGWEYSDAQLGISNVQGYIQG